MSNSTSILKTFSLNQKNYRHFKMRLRMKLCLFLFQLIFLMNAYGQSSSIKKTELTVVQGNDTIKIMQNSHQIALKALPFKLVFHTINTDAVFLSCSFDSTSYFQILSNQKDSLTCFESSQTFSEVAKNFDRDISVVKFVNRGYHCLFAYAIEDEQFVRFDSVQINTPNDWTGVRTVETIFVLPDDGIAALSTLKGKFIYLVFSPSVEKNGHALRIKFE